MRNLSLFNIVFFVLLFSKGALASDKFCGLNLSDKKEMGLPVVLCKDCWNNASLFAMTGAAAANRAGINSIVVEDRDYYGRRGNQFLVTLSPAYENSSVSVGAGVGVASGTYTNNAIDPSAIRVDANRTAGRYGNAGYGPYRPKEIPKKALRLKCKNMEDKAAKEKIKRDKAEALAGDVGNLSGADYDTIRHILNNITNNVKPWDDCSACVTESVTDNVQSQ